MTNQTNEARLEAELRKTFATAATRAPSPAPDLLDQVSTGLRGRRRRRRTQTTLAVIATVAVATGSTLVAQGLFPDEGTRPGGVAAGPGTTDVREFRKVDLKNAKPIENVWPEAVHKIPDRLPNGREFRPEAFVGGDGLLVSTESGTEKADRLSVYNLTTKTVTPGPEVVTPDKVKRSPDRTYASDFTVGDGRVAWWMGYSRNGKGFIEIWSAPLDDRGTAKPIVQMEAPTQDDGGGVDNLAIVGGKVIWSIGGGGVYEAPVDGGRETRVPDTEGYHLMMWPWIGTPGTPGTLPSDDKDAHAFETVRDLRSGERRKARLPAGFTWTCGVTWCRGFQRDRDADLGGIPVQRRDGTDGRLVQGEMMSPHGAGYDRFLLVSPPVNSSPLAGRSRIGQVLYDLETGTSADIGAGTSNPDGSFQVSAIQDPYAALLSVPTVKGEYFLINLAAIK
jgi:hypothetical protein